MTGLNHVQPGGAPIVVRLSPSVTMTKISVGPMDNNAYLLQTGSGATVLIDAANNSGRLLKLIGDEPLDTVVTTHRHGDHWQALAAVADATGARLVGGRPDVDAIAVPQGRGNAQRLLSHARTVLAAQVFKEHAPVGHHNPCVTAGNAGDVEANRRRRVPPDEVFSLHERDATPAGNNPATEI